MKGLPGVGFSPGRALLSRAQFRFRLLLLWIYAMAWLAALAGLSFLWTASFYVKALPFLLLVLGTPTDLFTTYDSYKDLWEQPTQRTDDRPIDARPDEKGVTH